MFQEALTTNAQKLLNFLQYSKSFLTRKNPLKLLSQGLSAKLKEVLTVNKKIKMARYRLNYQKYKLAQFEQIIAQNNEHVFLKGRTLNEMR
ncbi:MAG: hypothetical protein PHV37_06190 [Candidatus Gastranaerophilales bacterium]|nr:hypothetical protein [Candidatus Gastranaerophilales bacterium]